NTLIHVSAPEESVLVDAAHLYQRDRELTRLTFSPARPADGHGFRHNKGDYRDGELVALEAHRYFVLPIRLQDGSYVSQMMDSDAFDVRIHEAGKALFVFHGWIDSFRAEVLELGTLKSLGYSRLRGVPIHVERGRDLFLVLTTDSLVVLDDHAQVRDRLVVHE